MTRRCSGCAEHRRALRHAGCKPDDQRLCRRFDVSLLTTAPGRTLPEYEELHKRIEWQGVLANKRGSAFYSEVRDAAVSDRAAKVIEWFVEIHRCHFDGLGFAGRFRTARGFYGAGRTASEGVPPEHIDAELRKLRFPLSASSKDDFARLGADFLERFFRVHPFEDGNGRLARLALAIAVRVDLRRSLRLASDRKSRREYLAALVYAHRHRPGSVDPEARPCRYHLRYLERWLANAIGDDPSDGVAELPAGDAPDDPWSI
jgi:fido (protein-threonine AMPylation protein)